MITQFQLHGCPYALRTRIVLHEKGIPFETVQMDRKNKPAEVLAVSPAGTSPVIFDGPVRLRSSPVINEYLEDRYPQPALMPADPGGRAAVRLAIDDVADDLGDATGELVRVFFRTPESERDPKEAAEARAEFLEALAPFDEQLAGRSYMVGEAFTLADASLYTQLRSALRMLKEDVPESMPNLRRWKALVESRPAVRAALAEEPAS
jgi:glutathione S-transferase